MGPRIPRSLGLPSDTRSRMIIVGILAHHGHAHPSNLGAANEGGVDQQAATTQATASTELAPCRHHHWCVEYYSFNMEWGAEGH